MNISGNDMTMTLMGHSGDVYQVIQLQNGRFAIIVWNIDSRLCELTQTGHTYFDWMKAHTNAVSAVVCIDARRNCGMQLLENLREF